MKLVPEGIEGQVPYKGPVRDVVHQLVGVVKLLRGGVQALLRGEEVLLLHGVEPHRRSP